MPNIFYSVDKAGRKWATWYGRSKRVPVQQSDGSIKMESRKQDQKRLGLVVDEENLLFFREDEGFYQFNPEDQSRNVIPPERLPSWVEETILRHKRPPVIVDFGGSYFLHEFINGIDYNKVINSIEYENRDRLHTMLQYYLLNPKAAYLAEEWYEYNFTKFLYPRANPASQRISEMLEALGTHENRLDFLESHISYLLKSTDEELCVLVDSTGCPNKSNIKYTRVSVHERSVHIEFRVIVVVQKSTGLPVYYEMIPGNVVDVSTIQTVIRKLQNMGYKVQYSLGDAAYSCPAVLERLVLSGIDFMTRLNPTYDTYQTAVEKHLGDLETNGKTVLFHGRQVKIFKCTCVIATDKETGKAHEGLIFLCRDINSWHGKSSHLLTSKKAKSMTCDERDQECRRFGLFALVTTVEMKEEDVLTEYYTRQAIEQFFDYAKNYANYMPVRCHKEETVRGHLLLSFIASFILVLIKNRLNILDTPYARIPLTLQEEAAEDDIVTVDNGDGTDLELLVKQEPLMSIFQGCPAALFAELQFQKADVYAKEVVPSTPTSGATEMYKAYHLVSPLAVLWNAENKECSYEFRAGEKNQCTRRLAFTRRPSATEEKILQAREKRDQKKAEEQKVVCGDTSDAQVSTTSGRRRGRPPGAKNKKTLEKEAELAKLQEKGESLPQKRGRGRPVGSKNKKTLEREAAEQAK